MSIEPVLGRSSSSSDGNPALIASCFPMGPKTLVDVKSFLQANSSSPRPAFRMNILLLLRRLVNNIIPLAHTNKNIAIDSRDIDAINLYNVLELALLYELKTTKESSVTFWSTMEYLLLHKTIKLSDALSGSIVHIAEQCPCLHSCVGRARGFIKKAMNERLLDECITLLYNNKQWYNPGAILHSSEDVVIFRAIVQSIKVFNFQFNVNSSSNNNTPKYIQTLQEISELQSKMSSSSYSMDRIFESFERGFQSVFSDPDSSAKVKDVGGHASNNANRRHPRRAGSPLGVEPEVLEFGPTLVPEGLHALVSFIVNSAESPHLFRQSVARSHPDMRAARRALMQGQTLYLPKDRMGIEIACGCLLSYLESLREPLLGLDLYHAFVACQELDEDEDRIRNLGLLCQQSPKHNWPLLVMFLGMLSQVYSKKASNKLSLVALSSLASPFLLRPGEEIDAMLPAAGEDSSEYYLATASVSTLACLFIQHCNSILQPIKHVLDDYEATKHMKLERVRALLAEASLPLSSSDADKHEDLVRQLYSSLDLASKRLISALNVPTDDPSASTPAPSVTDMSVDQCLRSPRLLQCGVSDALKEFDTSAGLLAMTSLLHFLRASEYCEIAATMVSCFARERSKFCNLAGTCLAVARIVRSALRMDPRPGNPAVTDFAYSFLWDILYTNNSYHEIFSMTMLIFDDAWKDSTERVNRLPSSSTYAECLKTTSTTLEEILHLAKPNTMKEMFETFYKKRSFNQRALAESMLSKTAKLAAGFRKTLLLSGEPEESTLSTVLDDNAFEDVRSSLPNTFRHYQFKLLYRLSVNGSALSSLYTRARNHGRLLLLVRDTQQCAFGALLTSSLAEPRDRSLYYGNSLTSVFTFRHGAIHHYSSSGDNSYFLLANSGELCIGAESPAIHLVGEDLCSGHSRPCETFACPTLASADEFTCGEVELFALVI